MHIVAFQSTGALATPRDLDALADVASYLVNL